MNSEAIERVVRVIVNTIENITKKEPVAIKILVYHDDTLIGESDPLKIKPDFREPPSIHQIDYSTNFRINVTDRKNFGAAVSVPLTIQVVEHEGDDNSGKVSSAAGDGKKKDKTKSAKKSAGSNNGSKLIGVSNVDLIPIILGEKNVVERLLVEEPKELFTIGTSWRNLPVLTVTLSHEESDFLPADFRANYLNITVESIYNPPMSFNQGLEYKAATIIPNETEQPEVVIFGDGKFSQYRDVELTKRWRCLSKLEGRGKLSKYKIDCNYGRTKNQLENFDLKKILEIDCPRIEWNYMSRHVLLTGDEDAMKDKLNKYKYWPFQFYGTSVLEDGKTKSRDSKPELYQCYVDVSELLYPGRAQTRTIAQLHPFNASESIEKTGIDKVFFNDAILETKSKDKKGKPSTKDSYVNSVPMESESPTSSPLFNESGDPVFVIIEFELREALFRSRTTEELTSKLQDFIGPPEKLSGYPYTGDLAEEQYLHCIRKLVETITESYRDFNEEEERAKTSSSNPHFRQSDEVLDYKYSYIPDEIDRFTQYLYDNGIHVAIQTSLKKRIVRLLDQKFKMQSCTWDSEECQNFVANAYLYLVEQMHVALNSENGDNFENGTNKSNVYYYAEECYELGNEVQAKNLYLSLVAMEQSDPQAWLNYAIFSKKIGDVERALQCCREAINLDRRHKIALLLYGVILAEQENYSAAEIFFKATTLLYPRFGEAWGILHLFFLRTEYFPGVDLTFRIAEECLLDENRDKVCMDYLENEPLAWSTILCSENRIYLRMAVFLLKLNLLDFAGIALAQELSLGGRSTSWLYYMAVHHYLLGRYEDAATHLKEARYKHGMDYSISGLMAHCYFKEEKSEMAKECYEFASTLFNRPADIHLINLRMGNYALNDEAYGRGKRIFLDVCKNSPTANSWLGLGIASYEMMDFNDAETALTEANRLDHTNPEVWAYLSLLNIRLERYEEFAECYRQTVKNDLQNAKLWLRITEAMESSGLSSPMILTAGTKEVEEELERIPPELD